MKSHYRLEDLPSRKPHVVEALLYASLVTLVVSRRLLRAVRRTLRGSQRVVPAGRWATLFAVVSTTILDLTGYGKMALEHRFPDHRGHWMPG